MLKYNYDNKRFLPILDRNEPILRDSTAELLAMNCMRKYFYRIVLGRVPKTSNNQIYFDFGSAYHKFREELKTKSYKEAMINVMNVKLTTVDIKHKAAHLNKERLLKSCQLAYDSYEEEKKKGRIEVIATEMPFNVELSPGLYIAGRADEIIKWNGKLWGRDFKTTTKDINFFSRGLDPNDQFTRYIVGESYLHYGPPEETNKWIEGIIVEVMQNLKTKGPNIQSIPISRTHWQIDNWIEEQKWFKKVLELAREDDIWMMQPHNCSWCDYHIVCKQPNERAMTEKLKGDYVVSPWDCTKVEQEVII